MDSEDEFRPLCPTAAVLPPDGDVTQDVFFAGEEITCIICTCAY